MDDFYDLGDEEVFDDLDAIDAFYDQDEWDEEDEFLGRAWGWLTRPGSRQRRMALSAARGALSSLPKLTGAYARQRSGGAWWGEPVGASLGQIVSGGLAGLLPEQMDYFADLAAEAEDEAEAEAFLGALIPLAAKLLPQAGAAIMRVAPHLIRGVTNVARRVHANPAARQMIRSMGTVVRNTGRDIARQVATGRPVTANTAVRQLARNTYRAMSRPRGYPQPGRRYYRRSYGRPCYCPA